MAEVGRSTPGCTGRPAGKQPQVVVNDSNSSRAANIYLLILAAKNVNGNLFSGAAGWLLWLVCRG